MASLFFCIPLTLILSFIVSFSFSPALNMVYCFPWYSWGQLRLAACASLLYNKGVWNYTHPSSHWLNRHPGLYTSLFNSNMFCKLICFGFIYILFKVLTNSHYKFLYLAHILFRNMFGFPMFSALLHSPPSPFLSNLIAFRLENILLVKAAPWTLSPSAWPHNNELGTLHWDIKKPHILFWDYCTVWGYFSGFQNQCVLFST